MSVAVDLEKKALYCMRSISLTRALCDAISEDDRRRIIGRFVFVYLDSFVPIAQRLKNTLPGKHSAKRSLTDQLNTLHDDYHGYYDGIRDKLASHRQELPLDVAIGMWNEIDAPTVSIFADDARAAYDALAAEVPTLPDFSGFPCEAHLAVPPVASGSGVRLDPSSMALTRGNAVTIIPTGALQRVGADVLDVRHTLNTTIEIGTCLAPLDADFWRLIESMLVVDVTNLYDLVYGLAAGGSPPEPPFLELLDQAATPQAFGAAANVLRASVSQIDQTALDRLVTARNKACAHVDPDLSFAQLMLLLDWITPHEIDALYGFAIESFSAACDEELILKVFLLSGTVLSGLIGVEQTDAEKPYDV